MVTYSDPKDDVAIIEFDPSRVVPLRTVRSVTIRGIDTRPIGFPTVACKEGRTTGSTCGVAWFSDGDVHFSQMCVIEGDSGSPVVVGDKLVGMVNAYYFLGCLGPETGTNIADPQLREPHQVQGLLGLLTLNSLHRVRPLPTSEGRTRLWGRACVQISPIHPPVPCRRR